MDCSLVCLLSVKSCKLSNRVCLICFPDIATAYPDKKSILMYVTSLFQVLPQQVTLEAIQEVETLPWQSKHTREERVQLPQQRFSQQVGPLTFFTSYFVFRSKMKSKTLE